MRLGYIVRRVFFLIGVIWSAATLNFILPHLAPRDPVREQIVQKVATMGLSAVDIQGQIDSMKKLFGLDQPLWKQYLDYMGRIIRFDLGISIVNYPSTVNELIAQSIPYTLAMVGTSTILAFLLGTIAGALLGWTKSKLFLNLFLPPMMIFSASPAFVIALILIYYLAFKAKLFPLGRPYGLFTKVDWSSFKFWLEVIHHAILPCLSLILVSMGGWSLGMRAMMVTVAGDDYMTFGEAKGLKGARLFFQYALRNALLPQITGLAVQLGTIVSGSTLVEVYFQYPGLGNRLGGAIASFDYYMISGIVFFMVTGIALATFFVDLLYPFLDPRISYQKGA
ncbi:MAG: ABC transporter permease [Anaerolineae bacterium]|nr:ABC transporter permease [Anaerolineae bacterium]